MINSRKKIITLLAALLIIDVISFFVFDSFIAAKLVFIVITLTTAILTIFRLEYGLLLLLIELIIGSQGYLFYWQFGDNKISFRIVVWLIVMLVFIIKFLYQIFKLRNKSSYLRRLKKFVFWRPFVYLFSFVIIGLISAYFYHNNLNNIIFDFNAWLYFLLLFPLIAVYNRQDRKPLKRLKIVFLGAAIYLSIRTLILLFIFTHNIGIDPEVYSWLRRTLIGEMTPTLSGWPRIFIQSQIFSFIAFIFLFWYSQIKIKTKKVFSKFNYPFLLLGGLFLSSIIISFSRSFWLGSLLVILISLVIVWNYYSFVRMIKAFIYFITTIFIAFLITYIVAIIPLSQSENVTPDFLNRISNKNEAAVVSRWSLLNPLIGGIMKEPILGQGFGATITYTSSDPRVLENNVDGEYTTYAFEWGYFDMWLKIGIIGLLFYLFLLFKLLKGGFASGFKKNNYLFIGIATSVLFLAIIHFFTPYLNHPLGIGFLLISSCLISQDKVY